MLTDQRSALPNIVLNHIFLLSNYFEDIEKKNLRLLLDTINVASENCA